MSARVISWRTGKGRLTRVTLSQVVTKWRTWNHNLETIHSTSVNFMSTESPLVNILKLLRLCLFGVCSKFLKKFRFCCVVARYGDIFVKICFVYISMFMENSEAGSAPPKRCVSAFSSRFNENLILCQLASRVKFKSSAIDYRSADRPKGKTY